jgi:DNA-directed RNA polymerase subunit RPC12/RpoP
MPPSGDADDLVQFYCQACGQSLAFSRQLIGRKASCRHCGHRFRVPVMASVARMRAADGGRSGLEVSSSAGAQPGSLLGMDPHPGHPATEFPASQTRAPDGPEVIAQGQDGSLSGGLLFVLGLSHVLVAGGVILMLFWFVHWALVAWLLLPIVAVFGPGFARRIVFLLSAGTVRV